MTDYKISIHFEDGVLKELTDGGYQFHLGYAVAGVTVDYDDFIEADEVTVDSAVTADLEHPDVTTKAVDVTFGLKSAAGKEYVITYKTVEESQATDTSIQPGAGFQKVVFGQVYTANFADPTKSAFAAPKLNRKWPNDPARKDRTFGFANSARAMPLLYESNGKTPAGPKSGLASPLSNFKLWVAGTGLITVPKPEDAVVVWFEAPKPTSTAPAADSFDFDDQSSKLRLVYTGGDTDKARIIQYKADGTWVDNFVPPTPALS